MLLTNTIKTAIATIGYVTQLASIVTGIDYLFSIHLYTTVVSEFKN